MKKLLLLQTFVFMAVLPISASTADDIAYIRKFYTEYKSAYGYDKNSYPPEKCYEIIKKYCTAGILKDMQDDPIGYDFPTDDYGMDEYSLPTLKIIAVGSNLYKVTFQVLYINPVGEKTIKTVVINVLLTDGKISNFDWSVGYK